MGIEVQHITKTFGTFKALNDVSIKINAGELVALLGPSGSGKTTLLRIIAGLEVPDPESGLISFSGENVAKRKVGDRGVGFVFQHYALFRHMTVFDNIAFGLRVKPRNLRPSKTEIQNKVMNLLHMIQLDSLSNRYPHQLSGGQRQRVALARALAVEPQVLLLDEPFGALDAKVRVELRAWLRRLHDEIHLTSVFVTHDQEEALELADRVAVMNNGHIEQFDTPDAVFHHPSTEFVMNFLGSVNIFRGRLTAGKVRIDRYEGNAQEVLSKEDVDSSDYPGRKNAAPCFETSLNSSVSSRMERTDSTSDSVLPTVFFVRPHDLEFTRTKKDGLLCMPVQIVRIHSAGARVRIEALTEMGETLFAEISHQSREELQLETGVSCFVTPRNLRVFRHS